MARNISDFVKIVLLKSDNCALALRKWLFCDAKPTLLPCKTAAFRMQNNRFCNALVTSWLGDMDILKNSLQSCCFVSGCKIRNVREVILLRYVKNERFLYKRKRASQRWPALFWIMNNQVCVLLFPIVDRLNLVLLAFQFEQQRCVSCFDCNTSLAEIHTCHLNDLHCQLVFSDSLCCRTFAIN